jgi:hypothetical protein
VRLACLPAVWAVGCFSPTPQPGLPCSDNDDCPRGLACNAANVCVEPGTPDVDAPAGGDAGPVDAGGIDGSADASGPTQIAAYRFQNTLNDEGGDHDGTEIGSNLAFVPGRPGAGQTLHIPTAANSWMLIPDSPAFDLAAGAVELWFRIGPEAPPDTYLGLISRDANATATPGHFNARVGHDRRIVSRIQTTGATEAHRCTSTAITDTQWHKLRVDFGPAGLVMSIDDIVASGAFWVDQDGDTYSCTDPWTLGIDGNDNPWIVGGLSVQSAEGTGSPVQNVAGDVDIDDLVIWAQ